MIGRVATPLSIAAFATAEGFDAHAADPVGSLGLEVEDFAEMTKRVLDVARTHAGGRLVSCLEGGYDLAALASSVQAHLEELLGA